MQITFDTETLGINPLAPIIQIGAILFDDNGNVLSEFSRSVDIETIDTQKFKIDGSTIKWWMQQDKSVAESVFNPVDAVSHEECLTLFVDWLNKSGYAQKVPVWSNINFDPPKLIFNLMMFGHKDPVHYKDHQDLRTLLRIFPHCKPDPIEFQHNALADCHWNMELVTNYLKHVNKAASINTKELRKEALSFLMLNETEEAYKEIFENLSPGAMNETTENAGFLYKDVSRGKIQRDAKLLANTFATYYLKGYGNR